MLHLWSHVILSISFVLVFLCVCTLSKNPHLHRKLVANGRFLEDHLVISGYSCRTSLYSETHSKWVKLETQVNNALLVSYVLCHITRWRVLNFMFFQMFPKPLKWKLSPISVQHYPQKLFHKNLGLKRILLISGGIIIISGLSIPEECAIQQNKQAQHC